LKGFSYTKNDSYLGEFMRISRVFHGEMKLNDASITCCAGDPAFYHKAQMGLAAPLAMG